MGKEDPFLSLPSNFSEPNWPQLPVCNLSRFKTTSRIQRCGFATETLEAYPKHAQNEKDFLYNKLLVEDLGVIFCNISSRSNYNS